MQTEYKDVKCEQAVDIHAYHCNSDPERFAPNPTDAALRSAVEIARRFPRDEKRSIAKIVGACQRPSVARQAIYALRRARVLALAWGNLQFGVRQLARERNGALVEAFCWDLEANVREVRIFATGAFAKSSKVALSGGDDDEQARNAYRAMASVGARCERACILALIPQDVVDTALEACEATLIRLQSSTPRPQRIDMLRGKFAAEFGISPDSLDRLLGHPLDEADDRELVRLGALYQALKDGFARVADIFPAFRTKPRSRKARTTITPPPSAPPTLGSDSSAQAQAVHELITLEQATELERLFAQKALTDAQRQAALARFGACAVGELRAADLPALVAYLSTIPAPVTTQSAPAHPSDTAGKKPAYDVA